MPEWNYFLWTDEDNIKLVSDIIPDRMEQFTNLPNKVIGVDICRCLILYKYGGVYFDTDYKLFRALDEGFLGNICVLGVEEYDDTDAGGTDKFGNAFMASAPGLDLWLDFVDDIFENIERRPTDFVVQLSGPHALTRFLNERPEHREKVTILPPEMIYPAFSRMKITGIRRRDTIGVHLCWGSWRNKPILQKLKNRARRFMSAI